MIAAAAAASARAGAAPNFVYVLLDDFGLLLGDEAALPQTIARVKHQGASFPNFFVSSPKCTPSRSAWLTGRYYHNVRPLNASTGEPATRGPGLNTTNHFDRDALFPTLHRAGYQTGLFGKIRALHTRPDHPHPGTGASPDAPPLPCLQTTTNTSGSAVPATLQQGSVTLRPSASHAAATTRPIPTSGWR